MLVKISRKCIQLTIVISIIINVIIIIVKETACCGCLYFLFLTWSRSQWPRGLRRRSAAARLLRSWVRIPPGAWIFVCCECCVLSDRGLCVELIARPEESYRLWCVVVCELETSRKRRPWPTGGYHAKNKVSFLKLSSFYMPLKYTYKWTFQCRSRPVSNYSPR